MAQKSCAYFFFIQFNTVHGIICYIFYVILRKYLYILFFVSVFLLMIVIICYKNGTYLLYLPYFQMVFIQYSGLLGFCPSYFKKTQRYGNWICFRFHLRWLETHTFLGPLERANVNHYTRR
jgi:hypothetical protein